MEERYSLVESPKEEEEECCSISFAEDGDKKSVVLLLFNWSNHFVEERVEESYQLFCSRANFVRAQYIGVLVVGVHVCHHFLLTSTTTNNSVQWLYLVCSLPFVAFPQRFFHSHRGGTFRLLLYAVKRSWKKFAALWIVLYVAGLQHTYLHDISTSTTTTTRLNCTTTTLSPSYFYRSHDSSQQFLHNASLEFAIQETVLICMLCVVYGQSITISMNLDIPHALFTSTFFLLSLWLQIIYQLITAPDDSPYLFNLLIRVLFQSCFVLVPMTLFLFASYYADRSRRISYISQIHAERQNTALKSNLNSISENDNLKLKCDPEEYPICDADKKTVENVLKKTDEDDFLQSIAIPYYQLHFKRLIQMGSTCDIILSEYVGTQVAVKRIRNERRNTEFLQDFKNQIELQACLRHPNIVQFIGASWDSYVDFCLVLEYMENGDVYTLLHSPIELSWSDPLLKIATDVAQGMSYLHNSQPPVVHRDLKSKNLLCSTTYTCKVSDFGESKRQNNSLLKSIVGTPYWLAPEILREEAYGTAADCYSFGIVLIELETRQDPYFEEGIERSVFEILMHAASGELKPKIPSSCLPARRLLIEDCLRLNPSDRPSMNAIVTRLQEQITDELICKETPRKNSSNRGKQNLLRRHKFRKGETLGDLLREG